MQFYNHELTLPRTICNIFCCIIIQKFSFVVFQSIVIDQVTGVSMLCEAVDLINRCNVTWDVSNCLCVCVYDVYQSILSTVYTRCTCTYIGMYLRYHASSVPSYAFCTGPSYTFGFLYLPSKLSMLCLQFTKSSMFIMLSGQLCH